MANVQKPFATGTRQIMDRMLDAAGLIALGDAASRIRSDSRRFSGNWRRQTFVHELENASFLEDPHQAIALGQQALQLHSIFFG